MVVIGCVSAADKVSIILKRVEIGGSGRTSGEDGGADHVLRHGPSAIVISMLARHTDRRARHFCSPTGRGRGTSSPGAKHCSGATTRSNFLLSFRAYWPSDPLKLK